MADGRPQNILPYLVKLSSNNYKQLEMNGLEGWPSEMERAAEVFERSRSILEQAWAEDKAKGFC